MSQGENKMATKWKYDDWKEIAEDLTVVEMEEVSINMGIYICNDTNLFNATAKYIKGLTV